MYNEIKIEFAFFFKKINEILKKKRTTVASAIHSIFMLYHKRSFISPLIIQEFYLDMSSQEGAKYNRDTITD